MVKSIARIWPQPKNAIFKQLRFLCQSGIMAEPLAEALM